MLAIHSLMFQSINYLLCISHTVCRLIFIGYKKVRLRILKCRIERRVHSREFLIYEQKVDKVSLVFLLKHRRQFPQPCSKDLFNASLLRNKTRKQDCEQIYRGTRYSFFLSEMNFKLTDSSNTWFMKISSLPGLCLV